MTRSDNINGISIGIIIDDKKKKYCIDLQIPLSIRNTGKNKEESISATVQMIKAFSKPFTG